mgnify:FL=1
MDFDSVKHPVGYTTPVPKESRDALETLTFQAKDMDETECIMAMVGLFGHTAVFWFCVCSAVKYLWRAGSKGNKEEDYDKARWYFKYALSLPNARVPYELRLRVQFAEKITPKVTAD